MPKNKPLRIIIDTNLWISFLISGRERKLDNLLLLKNIYILFSTELIDELTKVVAYPKLKKYFQNNAVEEMLLNIETYIGLVEVKSIIKICRDPKDNFLLALAKDGKADFLLTGDNDLLILEKFERTKILTITKFLESYAKIGVQ